MRNSTAGHLITRSRRGYGGAGFRARVEGARILMIHHWCDRIEWLWLTLTHSLGSQDKELTTVNWMLHNNAGQPRSLVSKRGWLGGEFRCHRKCCWLGSWCLLLLMLPLDIDVFKWESSRSPGGEFKELVRHLEFMEGKNFLPLSLCVISWWAALLQADRERKRDASASSCCLVWYLFLPDCLCCGAGKVSWGSLASSQDKGRMVMVVVVALQCV